MHPHEPPVFPNELLRRAFDFVEYTNKNVFLTGKAGTGKTTFLHNLRKSSARRMAVVAPTGVAAINAGGVTIHSFFQLPFGPFLPGQDGPSAMARQKKFRKEKIDLVRSLDLLVIDEISMVRSDVLDGIDETLRRYRQRHLPFGGLQLLMIGDLHQLAPIVKDDEWRILQDYYETMYFFGSRALQQSMPVTIELTEVFRQSDTHFIGLLNKVRTNQVDYHTLQELNRRYDPSFVPPANEEYITLTTHNHTANKINAQRLDALAGKASVFNAVVQGDFPEHAYPADLRLELKENAQVMFVKNDPSADKLFYNGKIGRVTRIAADAVYVRCQDDKTDIRVAALEWSNFRYTLGDNKKVKEETAGTFTQVPLKLAWAITIHKSQGLTFDRAIIDAQSSFAHGQVYVALSRCRTLEGMVLRSRIGETSIVTDETVNEYSREVEMNVPDETYLEFERRNFESSLLLELFDFESVVPEVRALARLTGQNTSSFQLTPQSAATEAVSLFDKNVLAVSRNFVPQLKELTAATHHPDEPGTLRERVIKGARYFDGQLNEVLSGVMEISVETDNKEARKHADGVIASLAAVLFTRRACMRSVGEGFSTIKYMQARANAILDFEKEKKKIGPAHDRPGNAGTDLAATITAWRNETASEEDVEPYRVLPRKAILELAGLKPANLRELMRVKGIGKVKAAKYGEALLGIVSEYCNGPGEERVSVPEEPETESPQVKPAMRKGESKRLTFDLYNRGLTVTDIARERNLVRGTIESHLASFVRTGELDAGRLIGAEKLELILDYLKEHPQKGLGDAKSGLGEGVSWFDLRVAANAMTRHQEN